MEDETMDTEGMGPGEPDEVINDPENVAAAKAIRDSTIDRWPLDQPQEP